MKTILTCIFLVVLSACCLVITYDLDVLLKSKSVKVDIDVKNLDDLKLNDRLNSFRVALNKTNDKLTTLVDSGNKLVKDSQASFDDNYWDLKATVANNTVSSKELADLIPKVQETIENFDKQVTDISEQSSSTLSTIDTSASNLATAGKEFLEEGTTQLQDVGSKVQENLVLLAQTEAKVNIGIDVALVTEKEIATRAHFLLFPPKIPVLKQIGILTVEKLFPIVLGTGFSYVFPAKVVLH
jgi:methyl-accepting chemotaxis protein